MPQLNSCFQIPASLFLAKKKNKTKTTHKTTGPFTFKTQRKGVALVCQAQVKMFKIVMMCSQPKNSVCFFFKDRSVCSNFSREPLLVIGSRKCMITKSLWRVNTSACLAEQSSPLKHKKHNQNREQQNKLSTQVQQCHPAQFEW